MGAGKQSPEGEGLRLRKIGQQCPRLRSILSTSFSPHPHRQNYVISSQNRQALKDILYR